MDINDAFDEVSMGEEKYYKEGYADGFQEGYRRRFEYSGYECGVEASYEIAMYRAFITVFFNTKLTRHELKLIQDFKAELDSFCAGSLKDISNQLRSLNVKYNKLCCILRLSSEKNGTTPSDELF